MMLWAGLALLAVLIVAGLALWASIRAAARYDREVEGKLESALESELFGAPEGMGAGE